MHGQNINNNNKTLKKCNSRDIMFNMIDVDIMKKISRDINRFDALENDVDNAISNLKLSILWSCGLHAACVESVTIHHLTLTRALTISLQAAA